jgi:hypothetical protein
MGPGEYWAISAWRLGVRKGAVRRLISRAESPSTRFIRRIGVGDTISRDKQAPLKRGTWGPSKHPDPTHHTTPD